MTNDEKLMQQALEALENAEDQLPKPYSTEARVAITALRERLARVGGTCKDCLQVEPSAERLDEMTALKDAAYAERNKVVAGFAALAMKIGYAACRTRTEIEGWSDDWHGCVYIQLPTGQVSWHYHDSEAELFSFLPENAVAWDGHDTDETYRRVLMLAQKDEPNAEPVAYRYRYIDGWIECQPLYTVSPPRTPLTDEDISTIVNYASAGKAGCDAVTLARAIERAHGIGENK